MIKRKGLVDIHIYTHTRTQKKRKREVSGVSPHDIKTRIENRKVSRHTYIRTHTHICTKKKRGERMKVSKVVHEM